MMSYLEVNSRKRASAYEILGHICIQKSTG